MNMVKEHPSKQRSEVEGMNMMEDMTVEMDVEVVERENEGMVLAKYYDDDITTSDTITPSIEVHGPITRSQPQQLNRQVNSFLCSSANDLENRWLPNNLVIIGNQRVDHGGHVGHQEGAGEPRKYVQQAGDPIQFKILESDVESNSESMITLPSN
jgi:hypothetical protein